jgi:hypothetical protein
MSWRPSCGTVEHALRDRDLAMQAADLPLHQCQGCKTIEEDTRTISRDGAVPTNTGSRSCPLER